MSEWIACADRLPEIGDYVLIYYCGGNWRDINSDPNRKVMARADFGNGDMGWKEFGALTCCLGQVSHWMPLPDAPT